MDMIDLTCSNLSWHVPFVKEEKEGQAKYVCKIFVLTPDISTIL